MRTNSSRHDPDCGAANGLGGTRATEIAALYGQLRAVHLRIHLATRASLTEIQLAKYQTLRGYAAALAEHFGTCHLANLRGVFSVVGVCSAVAVPRPFAQLEALKP